MIESKSSNSPASDNIEAIIRVEEEHEGRAAHWIWIPHLIGSFVGTIYFVALQCILIGVWVLLNMEGSLRFDPFPYPLLSVALGIEAVLLTSFVLIRQNRMDLKASRRNHLDLQINLLAEKEVTKVLQMLQRLHEHLDVPGERDDEETKKLIQETSVDELAKELVKKEKQ